MLSIIYAQFYIDSTIHLVYNNGTVEEVTLYNGRPPHCELNGGYEYGNFKGTATSHCKLCKKGL